MNALLRDVRTGVRSLWSARGISAAAIVVLALGIGANIAIFAVVDALLVKPLPFRDPGSLALVFEHLASRRSVRLMVSAPAYVDLRGETAAFDGVEALARTAGSLDRGDHADGVTVAHATSGLLPLLGTQLPIGRGFVEGDSSVALLSEPLWRTRFAADPGIVGRQIQLDGVARTIIGVLPRALTPFFPGDIWTPLSLTREQLQPDRREYGLVLVLARLRAGLGTAQERLDGLTAQLREANPLSGRSGFEVAPLREVFLGELRPGLLVLMGAVGFVLLIACANVANLLLVRAATRQRELALRAALGAGRAELARQLVVEGVVLALAGGALGVLIALWAIELLAPLGSDAIRSSLIEIDARALGFALVVSLVAGAAAGLVPAIQATRPDLASQLKDGARRFSSGKGRRVRDALVVAEVALALVLLFSAAHELRAYRTLLRTDPGFDAPGALSMAVSLPPSATPGEQEAFFTALVARARTLPGVEAAGFVIHLPLGGAQSHWHFDVEGPGGHGSGHVVEYLQIHSPGTLAALRVPLVEGRDFAADETAPVVLVNQAFARRYFAGESAVGKRVRPYSFHFEDASGRRYWPLDAPRWFTIVGVAADVRQTRLSLEPRPEVVLPLQQFPVPEGALVVRGGTPAHLEALLASLAPEVAAQEIAPLDQIVRASTAQQRDPMILLVLLSLLALLMAGMGVYGVMSWVVAERGRELSIRMALGAESLHMWRLILGQGLLLAASGVALGIAASYGLSRAHLAPALDPGVCVALSAVLLFAALLASFVPARKAARIDPRTAFRLD